jgi:Glutathione S-transferase
MKFCPFTQRVRIVLNAKNAPHDIVYVNLKNKPDWISKVHPEGKVPALDTGDKVIVESLDIAEFLDEKYPDPSLYPSDSEVKSKDKELIQKFGKVNMLVQLFHSTAKVKKIKINPIMILFTYNVRKRCQYYFNTNIQTESGFIP